MPFAIQLASLISDSNETMNFRIDIIVCQKAKNAFTWPCFLIALRNAFNFFNYFNSKQTIWLLYKILTIVKGFYEDFYELEKISI